uniref:C2H2-type domain-containing protein n=1 Tax=Electrophorus electricus TaxID=8005 RepID=A0A4W4GKS8_ELEEL
MLGLQETRPTGTPSTKTYSCVACSATFHGLASLLVHQASHASEISSQSKSMSPTCSHCGSLFASKELLEKHQCMVLPPPAPQSMCICECGEEFQEFSAIQEHKKLHEMEKQVKAPLGETFPVLNNKDSEFNLEVKREYSPCVTDKVPLCENSPFLCIEESLQQNTHAASLAENKESTKDISPAHSSISEEHHHAMLQPSDLSSLLTISETQNKSFKNEPGNVNSEIINRSDSRTEESPKPSQEKTAKNKNTLLKLLASAYMNRRHPAQINWGQSKRVLPPRKVSPRAPIQATSISQNSGSSKQNVKSSKTFLKKRFVYMTKTFYPVVALETHQKLCRDNTESRHQCGLCRRVFQDMDSLIMHHACHRKERVKVCRCCRQFVISENSVPDNHICSSSHAGTSKHFPLIGKELLASDSPTTLHTQNYSTVHFAVGAIHGDTPLNKHNCQWITSLKCSAAAQKDARVCSFGEEHNAGEQLSSVDQKSCQVNVGVNTDAYKDPEPIKSEELHAVSPIMEEYQMGLMTQSLSLKSGGGSAKSFFDTEASESSGGEQWTVPLDDAEIDVLIDNEEENWHLEETPRENSDEDVVPLETSINNGTNAALSGKDFQVHVSDSGIRRFSCNRCQKSYSRRFTLKEHLKICGARKLIEQHSFGKASTNILGLKKRFPCPHCGTSFTRKDNMNMHRKRCQSVRNANAQIGNRTLDKKNQEPRENMFVLPPASKNQVRQGGSNNSGGGSWGIMSLPSMLPRKVTCECGASFTCPRLLFEHLQMHALESYICSHCGENLQSWADFEAHQQLHEQHARQRNEQEGSQIQHQQPPHTHSSEQNLKKQPQDLLKSHLNYKPPTDPCVCHRCKKVFRLRSSLLRHLRLNCRDDIVAQKKYSCSRCGMAFQSSLSHKVHIQGNVCIPTFKPIRCPVCVRWFSCLDGLKKHLVAHSQQKVLVCQICGHNCPNHQALEEHKKKVHGMNRASESATVQSAHVSQSSPSNAFRCQLCQRIYPKIQSLKDHLRKVHRPKDQNLVTFDTFDPKTGALVSSKETMQQSQYKQFECHICARVYPDIQSLKNHRRRVHRILGGRLQTIKGFVQQSHSIQFQCQICLRSYPNIRSLRNHRRRVHRILGGLEAFRGLTHQRQDNLFKCQICQRSYPDIKSLKNHRRRVHRILGSVIESTEVDATDMGQSRSEVFHVTVPSEPFEQQ